MLMPSIFGENLFDDFMDFPFGGKKINTMMKTDIRDTDSSYELDIDMPGFKKEDIKAQLKDGYLTISASTSANNETSISLAMLHALDTIRDTKSCGDVTITMPLSGMDWNTVSGTSPVPGGISTNK